MRYQPSLQYATLAEQETRQSAQLKDLLHYLAGNCPFYKRLFAAQAVDFALINSISDLTLLPFTSKEDMQEYNDDFLCVPKSEVREYTATSGTLGKPVIIALTENDLQRLAYNEEQSFRIADGNAEDVYQLMLTLDRQFMAGMAYYSGIRKMGAASVRTGPGLPSLQWETAERLKTTALVTVPSFLPVLANWSREHGKNIADATIQKVIAIGEPLRREDFSLNALGFAIKESWPDLKLYSTYAATEMQTAFTECSAGRGGHHQPDLVIVEIVDEEGKHLPDGEAGEVVITTLGIEGMPLLRYRTGDIAALHSEPCTCGRSTRRLGPVIGRKKQMIKYKGTTLYPPAIFDMLNGLDYVLEYAVEVFSGELGTDELRLHLHCDLTVDECERKLKPLLQSRLRVIPQLVYHSGAALQEILYPHGSRKPVKFVDSRG